MEPAIGYSLRGCSSSRIGDGLAAAVDFANNGETPAVLTETSILAFWAMVLSGTRPNAPDYACATRRNL